MTGWLIQTFIKTPDNLQSAAVRTSYGRVSSWVGILCNVLLFLAKLLVGAVSGSVAVTADAVNNLSDASSSIISLLGFQMASKPADQEHPYGHGRYEYLAGLSVSVLILVIGVELLQSSAQKILSPSPVEFGWVSAVVLTGSILLKLWMSAFNRHIGRRIDSNTLLATAADSRNDAVSTTAVLAAALVSHFSALELDGWMGLAVAVFILYSGFGLVQDTLNPLLGTAPNPKLVADIRERILSYPGVLGTHDLMLHDYGPGRQFGSVHVEMAAEDDVLVSHDVIDSMERSFLKELGLHMIIHFDPIVTKSSEVNDLRCWLAGLVKTIHPGLTIHDLRVVPGKRHTKLIFDCVVPQQFAMPPAELKAKIGALVIRERPDYSCVITIDTDYAALPH